MLKSLADTERKYTINCTRIDTSERDERIKRKYGSWMESNFQSWVQSQMVNIFMGVQNSPGGNYQAIIKFSLSLSRMFWPFRRPEYNLSEHTAEASSLWVKYFLHHECELLTITITKQKENHSWSPQIQEISRVRTPVIVANLYYQNWGLRKFHGPRYSGYQKTGGATRHKRYSLRFVDHKVQFLL